MNTSTVYEPLAAEHHTYMYGKKTYVGHIQIKFSRMGVIQSNHLRGSALTF